MSIASTPTLLSLDRFAKIVGLNPVHFAGATAGDKFPLTQACGDVWSQYAWQTPEEFVSREEVAYEIAKAEADIKNMLGYSPAPDWEWRETHSYPGPLSRYAKKFALRWGKVIAPGQRAAVVIDAEAQVTYSDADNDGWDELATVLVATDVTDPREIKLFYAGNEGLPEYEIRPLRKVTINAGLATIQADSWLFIKPELWQEYPDDDTLEPIDISTTANFVEEVEVYRVFNDTSQAGAKFLISGPGAFHGSWCQYCGYGLCPACGATTQDGTFALWSGEIPQVIPYPASYGDDDAWHSESFAQCGSPRLVGFNYYAGEVDKRYDQGIGLDPLSNFWADTIAWMAVARLPRGICGCDNIRQRINAMQRDLTRNDQSEGFIRVDRMDVFSSAFGTRAGEVRAWQAVTRLVSDPVTGGGAL